MKKINKTMTGALMLAVASAVFIGQSQVAEAKVYSYDITEESFPYQDYADRYPDLKAAFGYDAAALYNHYKYTGVIEGRTVKITKDILEDQSYTGEIAAKIFALDVLDTIVTDDMTDAEKVRAVEAWMTANITYGASGDASSYHITGPMATKPTLEEGYAETFEFFMDALGIESITVTNDVTSATVYNKVNVGGTWYVVNIPAGVVY